MTRAATMFKFEGDVFLAISLAIVVACCTIFNYGKIDRVFSAKSTTYVKNTRKVEKLLYICDSDSFIFKMRLTSEHHDVLLNFAEKNQQIITNSWSGLSGNINGKVLWEELTTELNGLGYGTLSTTEYKRRLTDWKSKVKAKAAEVSKCVSGTGGGPSTDIKLTQHEKRLLSLMGHKSYKGDTVQEMGIELKKRKCYPEMESNFNNRNKKISKPNVSTKVDENCTFNFPEFDTVSQDQCSVPYENSTPPIEEQIDNEIIVDYNEGDDHSYYVRSTPKSSCSKPISKSTERRRKVTDLSREIRGMNDQSTELLYKINTNLDNINNNLTAIAASLNSISAAVCVLLERF